MPDPTTISRKMVNSLIVCHSCGELGHKVNSCPKLVGTGQAPQPVMHHHNNAVPRLDPIAPDQRQRPLNEVTCYKVSHFSSLYGNRNVPHKILASL